MKRNVLLIGSPRSGKTTILNYLVRNRPGYEAIRGDVILTTFKRFNRTRNENGNNLIQDISSKESAEILFNIYKELKIDVEDKETRFVIDSFEIELEDAISIFRKRV